MTTVLIMAERSSVADALVCPGVEVVGRTDDPEQGVELAGRLHPEVVAWVGPADPALVHRLRVAAGDSTAIVVFGPRESWLELEGALAAGADGYAAQVGPLDATIRALQTAGRLNSP